MRDPDEIRDRLQYLCEVEVDPPHSNSISAGIRRAKIRELNWVLQDGDHDAARVPPWLRARRHLWNQCHEPDCRTWTKQDRCTKHADQGQHPGV